MHQATKLRALLSRESLIIAPGAYDCITARSIEHAGFSAVYMTGGGTAMAMGYPDFGLTTMTEMAENAGRIATAVDVPVIADADTGYGNELNVVRTVRAYEQRGVAAIQLEDQVFPKRCGHLDGKQVTSVEEFCAKIRAASSMKQDPDTLIVARTDARAVNGFDDAVHRMNAALEAGADIAFLEAPQTVEEVRSIPARIGGPCLLNVVRGGKTPLLEFAEIKQIGYRVAILPGVLLRHIVASCDEVLHELRTEDRYPESSRDLGQKPTFARFGSDVWDEIRTKFR